MTDDGALPHELLAEVARLERVAEIARLKTKRLTLLTTLAGIVAILAALLVAGGALVDNRFDDNDAAFQIGSLRTDLQAVRSELKAARLLLEATDALERAREECSKTFAGAISVALSEYLAALGDLVVTIATFAPGPERAAQIEDKIAELRRTLLIYRGWVQARTNWEDRPVEAQLPCPVEVLG